MNSVARLHTILHNIANRLSSDDVKNLFAIVNCDLPVEDAYAFFLSMESAGEIDETNLTILKNLLRAINRQDLFVYLTLIPQVFSKYFVFKIASCRSFARKEMSMNMTWA